MKGQPLIPFLLIAVAGLFLMLILAFIGLGQPGEEEEENGNGDDSDDPVEVAEAIYEESCLSCHGDNMEGAAGPPIAGHDTDAVLTAIEEGPGSMPADLVSGEEAELVADYVSQAE